MSSWRSQVCYVSVLVSGTKRLSRFLRLNMLWSRSCFHFWSDCLGLLTLVSSVKTTRDNLSFYTSQACNCGLFKVISLLLWPDPMVLLLAHQPAKLKIHVSKSGAGIKFYIMNLLGTCLSLGAVQYLGINRSINNNNNVEKFIFHLKIQTETQRRSHLVNWETFPYTSPAAVPAVFLMYPNG